MITKDPDYVKQYVEVPQQLINLIHKNYDEIQAIEQVIIAANIPADLMYNRMGAFVPETGVVAIDIAQCTRNTQWFQHGVFFFWNAWLNMVLTVLHEGVHAVQWWEDPAYTTRELDDLEEEANRIAIEVAIDYLHRNPLLPDLKEFGWAKTPLLKSLQDLYPQHKPLFDEEFACLGTQAAANAVTAAMLSGRYRKKESMVGLMRAILRKGDVGAVIGKTPFLRASDVVALVEVAQDEGPED